MSNYGTPEEEAARKLEGEFRDRWRFSKREVREPTSSAPEYKSLLAKLQLVVNSDIVAIDEVLTNSQNAEWFVAVTYKDGSKGAVEGDGIDIVRIVGSRTEHELLLAIDPEELFFQDTEPREV